MAAVKKINKEGILEAAYNLARREGIAAITARKLAKEISCSTQPIYENFVDMADVDAEIAAISAQHGAAPEEVKKIIKGNGTMGLLLANILRRKAAHVVIDSAK